MLYSLADFDPTIIDSDIILADRRDGEALSPAEGPYRVIAPHDKRPARSAKMVSEIDVHEAGK